MRTLGQIVEILKRNKDGEHDHLDLPAHSLLCECREQCTIKMKYYLRVFKEMA